MYVYVMLKTKLGQHQMLRNEYGSVQTHLEPIHVKNVVLPIPDDRRRLYGLVDDIKKSIEAKEMSLDLEYFAMSNRW